MAEQTITTGLGGGTTTTAYVGSIEEVATSGTTTTTTTYYYAGIVRVALATSTNGGTPVFSYLGNDAIGRANVALDASGNPQASQLYSPYGSVRSSTSRGRCPPTTASPDRARTVPASSATSTPGYDPWPGNLLARDSRP